MKETFKQGFYYYFVGFVLSIMLTLAAYVYVVNDVHAGILALSILSALAVLQLVVQLIFFLHLGDERKPRFKTGTFLYMGLVVSVVVFISIWIMKTLHSYHMPRADVYEYLLEEEGRNNYSRDMNDANHENTY